MRISCIVPTCDRPDFLPKTIRSILDQSLKAFEILVINNGKEDMLNLPEGLERKVTVHRIAPYAGVAQARNFGAYLAQGDYLAFLDDDDIWNPNYLMNVSAAIEEGPQCILSRIDKLENGQVLPWKNPENMITIKNMLTYNPGAGGSNVAIKKELFFKVRGFDPKLPPSEDKALVLEVLRSGQDVKVLPDNQIIARIHSIGRLTDNKNIIEGICQFTRKYSFLMNREEYFTNWYKIYDYKYRSGDKKSIIPFVFLYLIRMFILIKRKLKK